MHNSGKSAFLSVETGALSVAHHSATYDAVTISVTYRANKSAPDAHEFTVEDDRAEQLLGEINARFFPGADFSKSNARHAAWKREQLKGAKS